MSNPDIILGQPVRTAIGAYNGTLKSVPATERSPWLVATVTRISVW